MAEFTIYTKTTCPYCVSAKQLLTQKGHSYVEKNVEDDPANLTEMQSRAPGARTVPQIFIGDYKIGGFTDLKAITDKGTLDTIIEVATED